MLVFEENGLSGRLLYKRNIIPFNDAVSVTKVMKRRLVCYKELGG